MTRLLAERGVWPDLVEQWTEADRLGDAEGAWRLAWARAEQGDELGSQAALERAADRSNLDALLWQLRLAREPAGLPAE